MTGGPLERFGSVTSSSLEGGDMAGQRAVSIAQIDTDAKKFHLMFISDESIAVESILTMGPQLHNLMQHWLTHEDELFTDVFSRLGK